MAKVYALVYSDEDSRDPYHIEGIFSTPELAEQMRALKLYGRRFEGSSYEIVDVELDAPLVSDQIMGIDFYSAFDKTMAIAHFGPEVRPNYEAMPTGDAFNELPTGNKFIQHKTYQRPGHDYHRVIVWGADLRTLITLFENYWAEFQKGQRNVPNWSI